MRSLRLSLPLLACSALLGTLSFAVAQDAAAEEEAAEEKEEEKPERERIEGELPWDWSSQLKWRSIGPANMGGRITTVAVHPEDTSTYYIGTAAGGLLKTTNNGVTYEYLFSDENTCSIGTVEVSRSNPDVVWVGTGEVNPRNSVSWGDGVYKSTDGGATWEHMGLKETFQIATLYIHPEDDNIVYVGATGRLWGPNEERGLFKTTDGGESWEKILFVDDKTGVIDLRVKPDDPNTLLVATYERQRDIYCSNDPAKKWGPGSAIYRSTNGGESFDKVTKGLPDCDLGRIGLDWYAKDPNVVFAIVESERITQEPEDSAYAGLRGENAEIGARLTEITEGGAAEAAGLKEGDIVIRLGERTILSWSEFQRELREYRAGQEVEIEIVREEDGEKAAQVLKITFATRPPPEEDEELTDQHGNPRPGPFHGGLGGQRENIQDQQGEDGYQYGGVYRSEDAGESWTRINSVNPRPMYYSEVRVDPSDENYIYVLGTSLYRSSDGGKTFTPDGHDGSVHVDHHTMWVDPNDGRHIILGNDGGIYVTWDRMGHWDHHNHVAIGQFYNITADNTRDYRVYGGLQDNGSWGGPNLVRNGRGPTNTDWFRVGGGDGFVCRVDADDPDLVYYESQNGGMGRRNLETGEGGSVRPRAPRGTRYRFNWNTPFILSSHNTKIHYSAGNHVFRSLKEGTGSRRISPDVTTTERGSATALAESPLNSDVLFVGTDDGGFWTTRDGGNTWIDLFAINEGLGPKIEAAPKAAAVAYEPEPRPKAEAAPRDDAVSGTWKCKASGEGIEGEGEGTFELDLLLKDGKVTGEMHSEIGEGKIKEGTFDEDSGDLRFSFDTDSFTLEFDAKIEDGELSGDISAAGGAFSFSFSGKREGGPVKSSDDSEKKAKATEKEAAKEEPANEQKAQDDADIAEIADTSGDEEDEGEGEKPKKRKFVKDTIDQLMPGRRYVSSITASRHNAERVYVTFDGHRSDDTAPYVFVSDDSGDSWESLRGNLPDSAGSVRDLEEDLENDDLLFLGTEFGAFVSIDRGESWTELGGNLPTVPVHDFVVQPQSNELIAGTHGRSIWILDITPLREISEKTMDADAHLYAPNTVVRWRTMPSAGSSGTRRFVGQNPSTGAMIYYSLDKKAKDIRLEVRDAAGVVVRELTASGEKGLHAVNWDLRGGVSREDSRGQRRFRRGRSVAAGTYKVVLVVGDETFEHSIEVTNDPSQPDTRWTEYEELWEELDAQGADEEDEVRDWDW